MTRLSRCKEVVKYRPGTDYIFLGNDGPKRLYPPGGGKKEEAKRIRNHAHMSKEDEQLFLAPLCPSMVCQEYTYTYALEILRDG
ncbi:MAG: hypothetical protein LBS77_02985 [Desulfovibrio sp.]|jgi:hypothetical protein|nr:hypothetical protein [Desulfovibrio sp.]